MKKLLLLLLPLCLGALLPQFHGQIQTILHTIQRISTAMVLPMPRECPGTDPEDPADNPDTANPEENDGPTDEPGEEGGNRTPVVENVTAAQIEGTKLMEIFYDLKVSDNRDCVVTVKWSTDNGNSFPLTATALVGAAGPGVVPGDGLKVTWDMGVDWNNQFTQSGRIKIIASRIPADYNPAGSTPTGGTSETGI